MKGTIPEHPPDCDTWQHHAVWVIFCRRDWWTLWDSVLWSLSGAAAMFQWASCSLMWQRGELIQTWGTSYPTLWQLKKISLFWHLANVDMFGKQEMFNLIPYLTVQNKNVCVFNVCMWPDPKHIRGPGADPGPPVRLQLLSSLCLLLTYFCPLESVQTETVELHRNILVQTQTELCPAGGWIPLMLGTGSRILFGPERCQMQTHLDLRSRTGAAPRPAAAL